MSQLRFRGLQIFLLLLGGALLWSGLRRGDSVGLAMAMVGALIFLLQLFALFSPTPKQRVETQIAELQKQGIYPQRGRETDEDVRRLLKSGHKLLAIRLHRQIHGASLTEAVEAVEKME